MMLSTCFALLTVFPCLITLRKEMTEAALLQDALFFVIARLDRAMTNSIMHFFFQGYSNVSKCNAPEP